MTELLNTADAILELLRQMHSITLNQTTVLLQHNELVSDSDAYDMLNQMVEYKDEIINRLAEIEKNFQAIYSKNRALLQNNMAAKQIKDKVQDILDLKQDIVKAEQNNIMIMQTVSQCTPKKMELPKRADVVAGIYIKSKR